MDWLNFVLSALLAVPLTMPTHATQANVPHAALHGCDGKKPAFIQNTGGANILVQNIRQGSGIEEVTLSIQQVERGGKLQLREFDRTYDGFYVFVFADRISEAVLGDFLACPEQ